ncbi:MAG TPA: flagellar motor protein MotB, partial [Bryobacteraceae bacterium]|nr:flagellar motor protein MotB [Bryobacteraceae bacterium]
MPRKHGQEPPENHERWLVSYADFMTLLFALFVVLFASSHHDRKSIESVSKAVRNGFQDLGAFSSSDSAADNSRVMGPTSTGEARPSTVPANAGIDMVELQRRL